MKALAANSPLQFAALRIGVALTILFKIYSEFGQLDLLYSKTGIIQDFVSRPLQVSYIISLPKLIDFLGINNEHNFLSALYLLFGLSAVLLLLGLKTKINIAVCLFIHLLVFNGYSLLTFGFDGFLFTLLFYSLLFPVGRVWSLDNLIHKPQKPIDPAYMNICFNVLQLHLCIVYFTAGVAKFGGQQWMDGTAIWSAINQPQFYSVFTDFFKELISRPGVSAIFSWTTLFVEIMFPVLIWVKWGKVRIVILVSVILMHVFIGAVMGLQLFAWIMIVFDLSAFGGVFAGLKGFFRKHAYFSSGLPADLAERQKILVIK
ncbi:HTTM domain-containing protein [Pedobacter frigoris]|uniref:HTTM domain-containing protein n=1 Tax=Pedobacter frigoris TaxID=2571272 RepID=UPI0029302054|nr:HTTM domain-containing protein [Pedobacter frigoris]